MNERLRKLRKALNMSQTAFGKRVGLKQSTITGYETGNRIPLDSVILLICKEFNVNEEWLRDGKGEMFLPIGDEVSLLSDVSIPIHDLILDIVTSFNELDDNEKNSYL